MTRRLNKRGWYVLVSISADDGAFCVDVLEHPDGGFGFQHFRSDPEDQGGWTPVGGHAVPEHSSPLRAAGAARNAVPWLGTHVNANRVLTDWEATLG